ncbi:hypothetical protein L9F63_014707, partial [Diploptera punctata]
MGSSTTVITTESTPVKEIKPLVMQRLDEPPQEEKYHLVWRNIIVFIYVHLATLYGFYLLLTRGNYKVVIFGLIYGFCGGLGITAGAHRLWAHRCYKAKWPLRLLLGIFQTIAFQNHIYEWSRDHRVHHKFSETDADPHNAKRGFFFSHIGWLLVRKHPDVRNKGRVVDMSDLDKDFVVVWQKRYYAVLMPLLTFILPTLLPIYLWGVEPWTAWYITMMRWIIIVNGTWCVNSVAHLWGSKPYDKYINPTENLFVSTITAGEGFHNYHHTFPHDYKAGELGNYGFNSTTAFIDLCAYMGWAYNLKTMPQDIVSRRISRTGDGSHKQNSHYE